MSRILRPFSAATRLVVCSLTAASLLVAAQTFARPARIAPQELIGTWEAVAEYGGRAGRMVVRIFENDEGQLSGALSLPTIDAWDIATVPVEASNAGVRLGGQEFPRTADGGLSGFFPSTLVPVHRIPLTFYKVAPIERLEASPIEAPEVDPVWTLDVGSPIWAAIAAGGEAIYVGADDGVVRAIGADSGEVRWSFATDGPIRARPVVAGELVLVHSDDGLLYALRRTDGTEVWQTRVEAEPVQRVGPGGAGSRYDHYASEPAVSGQTLFVGGADGRVVAVGAADGAIRWTFDADDAVGAAPVVARGRVLFGSFDGKLRALDAGTGQLLWTYDSGAAMASALVVAGDLVIAGSRSYDLLALHIADGQLAWSSYFWFSWIESVAGPADGRVYASGSDNQLLAAIEAGDGSPAWELDAGGSVWAQAAIGPDAVFVGTVGVGSYIVDHRAVFVAADRSSGTPLWKYTPAHQAGASLWGFAAAPAVNATMVFAATIDGRVMGFRQH